VRHLVQPPGSRICGQTCVAMLADVHPAEAMVACRRKGATAYSDLRRGLAEFNLRGGVRVPLRRHQLPPEFVAGVAGIFHDHKAVARVRYASSKNWGGHWVALGEGKVWDPSEDVIPVMSLHEYASFLAMRGLRFTSYMPVLGAG
jgi:hypothetical protein